MFRKDAAGNSGAILFWKKRARLFLTSLVGIYGFAKSSGIRPQNGYSPVRPLVTCRIALYRRKDFR
ncbi:hypothetical protein CWS72_07020 [Telmatospirillum siberiense]|uniref:Uncharacterized protein n=1 Tax=Telmatospirillum siberiense TaxID=382514 RepID=A0A2N3PY52_9PROT|nr:hypothetical protein CWS72_07020 [Telmatospirillum siberiense]